MEKPSASIQRRLSTTSKTIPSTPTGLNHFSNRSRQAKFASGLLRLDLASGDRLLSMRHLATLREALMRISLRTLFAIVTAVAFACAALRFAEKFWWSVSAGLSLFAFTGIAIVAVVGRGERRIFCIGFVISVGIYAAVLYFGAAHGEFLNTVGGRLPTSYPLQLMHQSISEHAPIDPQPDEVLRGRRSPDASTRFGKKQNLAVRNLPDQAWFMHIGHLLWAMLIGCCGGIFARYVYDREKRFASDKTADLS